MFISPICFFYNLIKFKSYYYEVYRDFNFNTLNKKTTLSKEIPAGKKIAIYGFGSYGKECFLKLFYKNKIIGVYDINFTALLSLVKDPNTIEGKDFDYIIVTVMDSNSRSSIVNFLNMKNIKTEKIIFLNYSF